MKTTINDINSYLFEQLDRITNDDLKGEDLDREIKRSDAVQKLTLTILESANLALRVKKHLAEYGQDDNTKVDVLGIGGKDD